MENIKEIAVSKLADIMSNGKLVVPKCDGWKTIFYNAGLRDNYDFSKAKLKENVYNNNWGKDMKIMKDVLQDYMKI